MIDNLPNDRRVMLVVIGFSSARCSKASPASARRSPSPSLLILVGFPALEALVFVLIFNTAPVAFGALGVPVTVLGAVTGLPPVALAKMVGRQLPFIALMLPFYVIGALRRLALAARSGRCCWWPAASFALSQFVASNFIELQR
jgi:lactate permease